MSFHVPEKYRVKKGLMASNESFGNNGQFLIKSIKLRVPLLVIASDKLGWEHVSVSLNNRCPTWDEMSFIKSLFWDSSDCVMQLHPPENDYVNNYPYCLHLWRPVDSDIQRPHSILVGVKQ